MIDDPSSSRQGVTSPRQADDRRQKSEDGGQKTEDRGQKTEDGGHLNSECGMRNAEVGKTTDDRILGFGTRNAECELKVTNYFAIYIVFMLPSSSSSG
jgi:hypothetical protein